MSGPTGVRGPQGPIGITGFMGPVGSTGMIGPQGVYGPVGVTGVTGITGSTGIQLYGNGSLVQCGTVLSPVITVNTSRSGPYMFSDLSTNPALLETRSSSISGQYDTSGLNYYGNPLEISNEFITIPAGKYFISAAISTTYVTNNSNISYLQLASYNGATYTGIVNGIPARTGSTNHLQCYYTPSTDTAVSVRVISSVDNALLLNRVDPANVAALSIVKIW
jgi:hypothetical protein